MANGIDLDATAATRARYNRIVPAYDRELDVPVETIENVRRAGLCIEQIKHLGPM